NHPGGSHPYPGAAERHPDARPASDPGAGGPAGAEPGRAGPGEEPRRADPGGDRGPDGSQCRPGSGGPGGRGLAAKTCGWRHWRHTPEPAVLTDWLQRSAISRAFSERLRTLEPDEHGKALRPIL